MRLYNWESRLARYIAACLREPFAWGRHDCALFAAGGVEALTGIDPAAEWRGAYRTEAQGLALIRKAGHADHVAAAGVRFAEVPPAMVMTGDLAVLEARPRPALGIVQGEMIYALADPRRSRGHHGLGLVPIEQAVRLLGVR